MIFQQPEEIIEGTKLLTRRVKKDSEYMTTGIRKDGSPMPTVFTQTAKGDRIKWQTGRKYAVTPKRGMPQVYYRYRDQVLQLAHHEPYDSHYTWLGRAQHLLDIYKSHEPNTNFSVADWLPRYGFQPLYIQLTDIRCEPLQDITIADALAEGIKTRYIGGNILQVWDYLKNDWIATDSLNNHPVYSYQTLWQSINTRKGTRWQDNPDVWVLEFEKH